MPLKLFNTMSRKKELFKPLKGKFVRMYSCGPTVYNYAHLGNLRAYIFSDVLKKTLLKNGYKVKHIMNITDVGHLTAEATDSGEDKLEVGAAREHKSIREIAEFYTGKFMENLDDLRITPPTKYTKATDHLKEQISLVKILLRKGYAYDTPEVIYFDTAQFKNYGKLARLKIKGLRPGARVTYDIKKRNASDFALWFKIVGKHKNHILRWPSPWGEGFPGWHIECSAMSRKYLGQPFDIHTGGIDHIPIHHTNEIAQSEAAYGKPLARFWLHNEFLLLGKANDETRMGKSLNNFITLNTVKEMGLDPLAFRYLCLNAHYRSKLFFSIASLKSSERALIHLRETVQKLPADFGRGIAAAEKKFMRAINDDLNTPQALAIAWDLLRSKHHSGADKRKSLLYFDTVFDLGIATTRLAAPISSEVQQLVNEREKARRAKDWQLADEFRKQVRGQGFDIDDTINGPQLKPVLKK